MTEKPLKELRHAVLSSTSGPDSGLGRTVEQLAPLLALLNSSKEPSSSHITSFNKLMSQSMLGLYELYPAPALKLAASTFVELFKSRISRIMKLASPVEMKTGLIVWETALGSILNGIQTYMEGDHVDIVQLGNTLYKPLFDILSSTLGLKLSGQIRAQAYLMLSDAAAGCSENKALLKDKKILGGACLGGVIATTNEYLVLDALFQLLARITPGAADIEGRSSLAAEVFQNPKARKAYGKMACDKLIRIFSTAQGREWDKAKEQILEEISKADLLRTQPFRLVNKDVKANSVLYMQQPPLDFVYVDSTNFVVNVQDKDGIDSLEIDYPSITSVHISHHSENEPSAIVHIRVSLSSPPKKGPDPVKFPFDTADDPGRDYFAFDIAAKDSERFGAALQARNLGKLIQLGHSREAKTKRSMGTLDLNVVDATSKTLAEKTKIVAKIYANSSPNSRNTGGTAGHDGTSHSTEDVHALSPSGLVSIDSTPIKGPPITPATKRPGVYPENDSTTPLPSTIAIKTPPKVSLKPAKPSFLDDNESLTDLDESKVPIKQRISVSATVEPERSDTHETRGFGTGWTQAKEIVEPMPPKPIASEAQGATRKRKRKMVVDSDEEIDKAAETQNQRSRPYNSQLLVHCETATTRSSIKYQRSAKKSPNSPAKTDFDAIPAAPSSGPDGPNAITTNRNRREPKATTPKNIVATRKSSRTTAPLDRKGYSERLVQDSLVVRPTKVSKPLLYETEEKTKESEIQAVETVNPETPALITSHKKKRPKNAPWKEVEFSSGGGLSASSNPSLKSPTAFRTEQVSTSTKSSSHDNLSAFHNTDSPLISADTGPMFSSLAPPKGLEPLDLDLAIAQAENLDMDLDFDPKFDPVVSAEDILQDSPVAEAPTEVTSDQEAFQTRSSKKYEDIVKSDSQPPNAKTYQSEHSVAQASEIITNPPLSPPPQPLPPRDIVMIDLTHMEDETSQDEVHTELHTEPFPRISSPLRFKSKRQRVSFAHDTKPPSCTNDPSPYNETAQSKLFSSTGLTRNTSTRSFIPRLSMKSDASILMHEKKFAGPVKVNRITPPRAKVLWKPQQTSTPSIDLDSDASEDQEMTPDDKILVVLNKIQEVIVHRMENKLEVPKMHARAAREGLLMNTAEDLKDLLNESYHHSEKLVQLEVEYAEHGRRAKQGLEDIDRTNQDIGRRLHQALLDHDRKSLSKKMPKTLVSTPEILLRLANLK